MNQKNIKRPLTDEELTALQNVIEYLWDCELDSVTEFVKENGSPEGHVFADLVTLDNFLNRKIPVDVEEYIND